jgi:uncharacterized lipoprotein YajG
METWQKPGLRQEIALNQKVMHRQSMAHSYWVEQNNCDKLTIFIFTKLYTNKSNTVMLYQTGDNAYFESLNENDRLFFEARYSF